MNVRHTLAAQARTPACGSAGREAGSPLIDHVLSNRAGISLSAWQRRRGRDKTTRRHSGTQPVSGSSCKACKPMGCVTEVAPGETPAQEREVRSVVVRLDAGLLRDHQPSPETREHEQKRSEDDPPPIGGCERRRVADDPPAGVRDRGRADRDGDARDHEDRRVQRRARCRRGCRVARSRSDRGRVYHRRDVARSGAVFLRDPDVRTHRPRASVHGEPSWSRNDAGCRTHRRPRFRDHPPVDRTGRGCPRRPARGLDFDRGNESGRRSASVRAVPTRDVA